MTLTEYGNNETVTLGELDVVGGTTTAASGRNREWDRGGCGGGGGGGRGHRSSSNNNDDLYEEVQHLERERVAASDRGSWTRRPPSTKQSLSSSDPHQRSLIDRRGYGQRDDEREHTKSSSSSSRHDNHQHRPKLSPGAAAERPPAALAAAAEAEPPRKRSADEMRVIADKKHKLMANLVRRASFVSALNVGW